MKIHRTVQLLATVIPTIAGGSAGLRSSRRDLATASASDVASKAKSSSTVSDTMSDPNVIPNTPGYNYHVALSQENFTVFPGAGRIKTLED